MQSVSSRIWTHVAVSISYDHNHYTTGTSLKMVLDASLLNPQHYKVGIKDKWSNPEKVVAPFPSSQCSSCWKVSQISCLCVCVMGKSNIFCDLQCMSLDLCKDPPPDAMLNLTCWEVGVCMYIYIYTYIWKISLKRKSHHSFKVHVGDLPTVTWWSRDFETESCEVGVFVFFLSYFSFTNILLALQYFYIIRYFIFYY